MEVEDWFTLVEEIGVDDEVVTNGVAVEELIVNVEIATFDVEVVDPVTKASVVEDEFKFVVELAIVVEAFGIDEEELEVVLVEFCDEEVEGKLVVVLELDGVEILPEVD